MNRYYFDHNATTPVSSEVLDALVPVLKDVYGNPSSVHHFGQAGRKRLDGARRQVAEFLNCQPREVVFLSGGTEADNLAVLGAVRKSGKPRKHVITTAMEHPAVLGACAQLEREGVAVSYLPAGASGVVDPEDVRKALRPETVLVSVMHANNELGTVQPVREIALIAHEAGALMHSDGVQAAGKIAADVGRLGVDLYSISGHKIYAPKGIGALYVRKGVELAPLSFGGRHEQGYRAGTENVPGAAALGAAAQWMKQHASPEASRLRELRDRLERGIFDRIPHVAVNGQGAVRTPNTTNLRFQGVEGEAMVIALDMKGFAVSSGAACSSGAVEPSHVLLAIGLNKEQAKSSLRFSLGRSNTEEQVDALVEALSETLIHLRRLSPTYSSACSKV